MNNSGNLQELCYISVCRKESFFIFWTRIPALFLVIRSLQYGKILQITEKGGCSMQPKQTRNGITFTLLSILYPLYLFTTKDPGSVSTTSLILALFLPIVGTIFALNIPEPKMKWTLAAINLILFILFLYYTISLR